MDDVQLATDGVTELTLGPGEDAARAPSPTLRAWFSAIAVGISVPWPWLEAKTSGEDSQGRKRELQRLLRLAQLTAADHGLLCPLVAVLWGEGLPDEALSWPLDQEWHGGLFILYVERDTRAAKDRLEDTLAPRPKLLDEAKVNATTLAEVRKHLESASPGLWPLLDALLPLQREGDLAPRRLGAKELEDAVATWAETGRVVIAGSEPPAEPDGAAPGDGGQPAPAGGATALDRIHRIEVEGFRGLRSKTALDTDADLVLLLGPNGLGKSSVLEALLLGVTGHVLSERQDHGALLHKDGAGNGAAGTVKLSVKSDDGAPREVTAQAKDRGEAEHSVAGSPFERRPNRHWPGTDIEPELQYRLTAFFQDEPQQLYDARARGTTLRSLLSPLPREAAALKAVLDSSSLAETLKDAERRLQAGITEASVEEGETRWSEVRSLAAPLRDLAGGFVRLAGGDLPDLEQREGWDRIEAALKARAGSPAGLRDWLKDRLEEALKEAEKDAKERSTEREEIDARQRRLAEVEAEMKALRGRAREADALLGWMGLGTGGEAETDLARLFRLLDEAHARWSTPPAQLAQEAERIRAEMALLDPDRVRLCRSDAESLEARLRRDRERLAALEAEAADLREWLARVFAADERVQALRGLRRALEQPLRSAGPLDDAWSRYEDWRQHLHPELEPRKKRLADLQARRKALEELLAQGLHPAEAGSQSEVRSAWERAVGRVASRFALAGTAAIRAEATDRIEHAGSERSARIPIFDLRLADGRGVNHFSTGQRSQLAVAQVVGQKLIAISQRRFRFPNRVLILDDVSTSYDLTNLTREALLWRQLAYHPDEERRLQVFLSSHHDLLSNRLIDLLVPPHGRSLRVLRFETWEIATGPRIEPFTVPAAPDLSPAFERALREVLC